MNEFNCRRWCRWRRQPRRGPGLGLGSWAGGWRSSGHKACWYVLMSTFCMHMNRSRRAYMGESQCVSVGCTWDTKKLATCPTNWMTLIAHLKAATLASNGALPRKLLACNLGCSLAMERPSYGPVLTRSSLDTHHLHNKRLGRKKLF